MVVFDVLLIEDGDDKENPELGEVGKVPACEIADALFLQLGHFNGEQDASWHHSGHIHPEL